jgi:hypothetical protein
MLVRERRAGSTHRVKLVVLATQPPFAAACPVDLVHLLTHAL